MPPTRKRTAGTAATSRVPRGKKQMLVILDQDLIKDVKLAAIEDDMKMSDAVGVAVREWLAKRKGRRS